MEKSVTHIQNVNAVLCTCIVITGGHVALTPCCPIHDPAIRIGRRLGDIIGTLGYRRPAVRS